MKINNKLTLAVSLAISLTACSPSMTIDEYIAQAKASLIADNSGRTALVSLKNAAKIDPKNSEVRFLLGEVFLGMGDYPTAEKEFEKSVEYGSVRKFLYSNLLEAKVRQHKFDEVEELVNYAKDSSEEEYNKVLTYAGISALYQNDVKLATFYIAKANELGEDYIYSIIGKSYLSNTKEEISRSLELINTITQNKPKQVDAWLAKAFLLQGQRKAKEAAESFEQYSVLRPKDVSVLFFIAQNYLTAGESDKAAIIINKLIEPFKNNSFINQMKGQLEFDNKNYKLAQQFAEKAYQLNPELISSTIISGMSSYHLEEFERAYRSLSKAQVYVSSTHLIHKLIAELQLRLGYDDDAYVTLEELVNQGNINEDFLVSASQELIRSGKASAAQKLLQASIEITPANAKVLREQGLIKLSINEVAAGIEILEKSLALDPSNQETEESLASAYLNTGQLDKAQKIANTWQESADKKVQGLILESAILDNQAKPEEAALMLKKALMLDSNSIAALLKLGVYAHKNNNIDQAFEYFKRGLVVSPQQPAVIKSLITLAYNNAELTKQLDTFLLEQVKIRPQSDELKLAQAYLYASQSKFEGAISLLNEIKGSKPPVSNINLLIGDYYSRLKNWKAAITSYQAAILFDASDYRAVTNLIRVYEHVNDIKLALDVVNKARLKTPNHYGLLLVQVNYQSRLGRTPKFTAIEQLKNHTQTKKHWVLFNTLGHIELIKGNVIAAIEQFEQAYKVSPTAQNAIVLSEAYGKNKQLESTIKMLTEYMANKPDHYKVEATLANAYMVNENDQMAELHYMNLFKQQSNDIVTLNNLAVIKMKLGKVDSALGYAKKAIAEQPNNAAVIDTYGMALYAKGKYKEALTYFDKALSAHPKHIGFSINKSKVMIKMGERLKAKQILQKLKTTDSDALQNIHYLLEGIDNDSV